MKDKSNLKNIIIYNSNPGRIVVRSSSRFSMGCSFFFASLGNGLQQSVQQWRLFPFRAMLLIYAFMMISQQDKLKHSNEIF